MQFINFYLDEYHPKPLSFDIRFAMLIIILSLVIFIIFGVIETNQTNQLVKINEEKQKELKLVEIETIKLQKELKQNERIEPLDDQIVKRRNQLNNYRKILSKISQLKYQKKTDYSLILKHLSEQPVNTVWLTKIHINKHHLSLQGSSTKPQSIPQYIDTLKNSNSLKREFDELKIERDNDNNQLINFSLVNGRLINEK